VTFDDGEVEIIAPVDAFHAISERLHAAGITPDEAGLRMMPTNEIELGDAETLQILKLVETLEEQDDIQNVYHNLKVSDAVWAQLEEA
jgi:transcriptional/translational regulatory protein YebC/TACO1